LSKRGSAAPGKYDPSAPRLTKREQVRQQKRRRTLVWNFIVLGTLVVFAGLVAWYVFANQRPGALPGEFAVPVEGAAVVPAGTDIQYDRYPPSSGNHYAEAAPWGVHTQPLPEGAFVSNLARGGVVFLFTCASDCAAEAAQFEQLIARAPRDDRFNQVRIVAAPYDRPLEAPIVALAWGHQLNLTSFDEALLLRWYRRFVNQGPALEA
jgi:hypothetical protein